MAIKLLLSACLVGQCCRYDAKNGPSIVNRRLHQMLNCGEIAVICPECAGGLDVPRAPAEIASGSRAQDVLIGQGTVINADGQDVTAAYVRGAQAALALAQRCNVKVAVLKSRSPSCGAKQVYDGTFSSRLIDGMGVTAALLSQNGIRIFEEDELDAAIDFAESQQNHS